MTIKQVQQQVIDNVEINKMDNEYYSFNIVDIRKLALDDVIDYLDDTEKHSISAMVKQGAYYMLLVAKNDTMDSETETLHPLDIGSMKNLKELNFDGLTKPMNYLISLLSKYDSYIVKGEVIQLGYGLDYSDAIVK